jgi:hypothetical protein
MLLAIFGFLAPPTAIVADSASCYGSDVVSTPSTDYRNIPWGSPTVHFSSLNGTLTTCCNSLDEIRTALDDIDDQLLDILNRRYVCINFYPGSRWQLLSKCRKAILSIFDYLYTCTLTLTFCLSH